MLESPETPEPGVETPELGVETPELGVETPELGVETPEPGVETPEPGVEIELRAIIEAQTRAIVAFPDSMFVAIPAGRLRLLAIHVDARICDATPHKIRVGDLRKALSLA